MDTLKSALLPSEADLRRILKEMLAADGKGGSKQRGKDLEKRRAEQARVVERALAAVADAQDDDERQGLREIYQRERAKLSALESKLRTGKKSEEFLPENLIEAAIAELRTLTNRIDDPEDQREIAELLKAVNLRVRLKFRKAKWGNREVNKLAEGTVCVGSAPTFIEGDVEGNSLWEVNRGDRI